VKGSFKEPKQNFTPKGSIGHSSVSKDSALSNKSGNKKLAGNVKAVGVKVIKNQIMNL